MWACERVSRLRQLLMHTSPIDLRLQQLISMFQKYGKVKNNQNYLVVLRTFTWKVKNNQNYIPSQESVYVLV